MSIVFRNQRARLEGHCSVEEAESLHAWMLEQTAPEVDLSACEHLHTAVLQTLLVARPSLVVLPADGFLGEHLGPLLAARAHGPARLVQAEDAEEGEA